MFSVFGKFPGRLQPTFLLVAESSPFLFGHLPVKNFEPLHSLVSSQVLHVQCNCFETKNAWQQKKLSKTTFTPSCHATMTSGSTPVTALFSLSRVRPWELRIFRKARRPCCSETSKFTRVLWQGSLLTNLEPKHGKPGAWVKVAVGWGFEGKIRHLPLTGLLELGVCLKFIS